MTDENVSEILKGISEVIVKMTETNGEFNKALHAQVNAMMKQINDVYIEQIKHLQKNRDELTKQNSKLIRQNSMMMMKLDKQQRTITRLNQQYIDHLKHLSALQGSHINIQN